MLEKFSSTSSIHIYTYIHILYIYKLLYLIASKDEGEERPYVLRGAGEWVRGLDRYHESSPYWTIRQFVVCVKKHKHFIRWKKIVLQNRQLR